MVRRSYLCGEEEFFQCLSTFVTFSLFTSFMIQTDYYYMVSAFWADLVMFGPRRSVEVAAHNLDTCHTARDRLLGAVCHLVFPSLLFPQSNVTRN